MNRVALGALRYSTVDPGPASADIGLDSVLEPKPICVCIEWFKARAEPAFEPGGQSSFLIVIVLVTDVTPSVARAIETALSASCWVLAFPLRTTAPFASVSTPMCTRLLMCSSASLALTLVVMAESATKVIGCERSESPSPAKAATGVKTLASTKQLDAIEIFMVCLFSV